MKLKKVKDLEINLGKKLEDLCKEEMESLNSGPTWAKEGKMFTIKTKKSSYKIKLYVEKIPITSATDYKEI